MPLLFEDHWFFKNIDTVTALESRISCNLDPTEFSKSFFSKVSDLSFFLQCLNLKFPSFGYGSLVFVLAVDS